MIEWLVKKTRTYKKLKFQFDLDEAHIARLEAALKEARKNDSRGSDGRFIEAE